MLTSKNSVKSSKQSKTNWNFWSILWPYKIHSEACVASCAATFRVVFDEINKCQSSFSSSWLCKKKSCCRSSGQITSSNFHIPNFFLSSSLQNNKSTIWEQIKKKIGAVKKKMMNTMTDLTKTKNRLFCWSKNYFWNFSSCSKQMYMGSFQNYMI